ncbi:MAG: YdcF family protein [Actinomycetes bacterium]
MLRWVRRLLALFVAVVLVYLAVTTVQVYAASRSDQREPTDAVLVLGAAQYDGRPSPALQRRLEHALALYRGGVAPRIMLTGSKLPADRFTEAYAGYKYLIQAGVPEKDLLLVDTGSSSWESLAAAKRVLRKENINQVTLVSDSYHNRRLQSIAHEIGIRERVSPTSGTPTAQQIAGETARVAVGQVFSYRRLFNATG